MEECLRMRQRFLILGPLMQVFWMMSCHDVSSMLDGFDEYGVKEVMYKPIPILVQEICCHTDDEGNAESINECLHMLMLVYIEVASAVKSLFR